MSLGIRLAGARAIDLSHEYRVGMPHWPTHPPFAYSMTKLHGEQVVGEGVSSASDLVAMGTHNGTHIDALCHFSVGGRLCGGVEVAGRQSYGGGVEALGAETIAPLLGRGVLLDFAAGGVLGAEEEIGVADLERAEAGAGVRIQEGDVVLLRTGWARYWGEPARYVNGGRHPGIGRAGARWLSERGIRAAGSDTVAFERVPAAGMPVHVHFLVEEGIFILENLDLEALSRSGARAFGFVAAPLKIRGATGAPVRAIAILEDEE
jgi:kynurenine formamidase